jgi:hypothetical protein
LTQLCAIKSACDNETVTGAEVDMQGYQGVKFIVVVEEGEVASFTIKAQQDAATGMGSAANLAGTAVTVASSVTVKKVAVLDIKEPLKRFVRCVVTVPDVTVKMGVCIIAELYNPMIAPVTQPAGEFHISPAEGTP